MENLLGTTTLVYWIFYTVLLLVAYHKIFTVYYLSGGLMKELMMAIFLGGILAAFSVYYWQIGVVVILIIALVGMGKAESSAGKITILVLAVAASIIVAMVGIRMKKNVPAESNDVIDEDTYEDYNANSDYDDSDDSNTDNYSYDEDTYGNEDFYGEDEGFIDEEEGYEGENELSGFVFPYSDIEYLDSSDVDGLSAEECRIARNEIYARHGRIFQDEELQAYFEQFDWYEGLYTAEEFEEAVLNEIEIFNRDFIIEYESEMGYR